MYRLRGGRPRSISPPAAGATLDPTAQRILIVEDSDCLRAVAVRTLSDRGYAVAEARHGEDALRVIEQTAEPFDLVVTEMMMPVMSGYKLGRRLARQRPALPVLYMSAARNENLVRYGPPSGQTQFLRKPFLPDDLVRQVNESLRPRVQECAAIPLLSS
jgi:two-component system, cell cycle sensor histidine kinase and response regulator CckA